MKIEELAQREVAKRVDVRQRNRARAEREIPEAIFLFDELVKHGMNPTMKKLEFHVEQREAA